MLMFCCSNPVFVFFNCFYSDWCSNHSRDSRHRGSRYKRTYRDSRNDIVMLWLYVMWLFFFSDIVYVQLTNSWQTKREWQQLWRTPRCWRWSTSVWPRGPAELYRLLRLMSLRCVCQAFYSPIIKGVDTCNWWWQQNSRDHSSYSHFAVFSGEKYKESKLRRVCLKRAI